MNIHKYIKFKLINYQSFKPQLATCKLIKHQITIYETILPHCAQVMTQTLLRVTYT